VHRSDTATADKADAHRTTQHSHPRDIVMVQMRRLILTPLAEGVRKMWLSGLLLSWSGYALSFIAS